VLSADLPHLAAVLGVNCHRYQLLLTGQTTVAPAIVGGTLADGPGPGRSLIDAPIGETARLLRRSLDRTVRQSSIGAMGFNRRKLEAEQKAKADAEATDRRATDEDCLRMPSA
jgi:hypothetical protein